MWDRGLEFSLLLLILSVHVGTHSCSLLVPRESSAVLEVNREAIHPQFFKCAYCLRGIVIFHIILMQIFLLPIF